MEVTASSAARRESLVHKVTNKLRRANPLFICTVVIPTVIATTYYGLIASDVYISESRFVVRSPERQSQSTLGALLTNTGLSRSQDDSYTVEDYILSRDALKRLNEKIDLVGGYSAPAVDIFSRFGGFSFDKSFEALYRYYQNKITVQLDSASSITTLTTRAFTPEQAYAANENLIEISEGLVNQLNNRAREDMIKFASREVETAEQRARTAALNLSDYRNKKGVIDPERQSALQLQQVANLQDEMAAATVTLNQVRQASRDNPQIPILERRISSLRDEIAKRSNQVTGGDRSLANKAAEYERLSLERDFADKQLAVALASLEQARNDAMRKQLYLERVVQPSKPDMALEPRRLRNILATLILGIIAWGVLTILIAGIREHRD
ncbi:hypothetical protein WS61_14000 [Burkholderia sp. ABCPW 11]|uniref:hypothetical protein n=1 Tax=Burkholderia sp. ABCPW 11 TaxID=1637859 RepID=UPI00075575C0|nr:hypothetical protein [Burkholderia sp. ABCPW 11]KVD45666.1 hypothetical protein WS61_14000 [Burkholderia sp. ABCPW 11]